MTCVVGIAENGRVVLAGDSAGVSFQDAEIYSLRNDKVFRSGPYLLGYTSSYRLGQILRYETQLPEPPREELERFLATDFVGTLRRALSRNGLTEDLGAYGSILVAVYGQLFGIGARFQVVSESASYAAMGSGRHIAYGALFAMEGSNRGLRQQAEVALRAAQRFHPGVREPFTFVESSLT